MKYISVVALAVFLVICQNYSFAETPKALKGTPATLDIVSDQSNDKLNHPALKVQGFEPGLKVPNRV